jgi:hypothetical protein
VGGAPGLAAILPARPNGFNGLRPLLVPPSKIARAVPIVTVRPEL